QDLMDRINALSKEIAAIRTAPVCPGLSRSLKRGSAGDDVKRLQQYLASDPAVYPEALVTGTYGGLTEAAVKRWQAKYNVVLSGDPTTTGFGAVGPKTISAIAQQCRGVQGTAVSAAPYVGGLLTVAPIFGGVPLTVTVQAIVNTANVCGGASYTLDYGDGSIQSQILVPPNHCRELIKSFSHVYRQKGNFTITLSSGAHRSTATLTVQ
ncbi:MAG: hypothetical protein UY63_C0004G0001, partial [Parcubacteria group bacterium GW2011_GWA2_51_10]